jgi:hypothetical protein
MSDEEEFEEHNIDPYANCCCWICTPCYEGEDEEDDDGQPV